MGRPPSGLDDYLDWQERLENYKASGLEVDVFCLQEGVSRTTFYKWVGQLKDGIPKSMLAEKVARERAESGEAAFVPITLKASPVEIELPNGGIVQQPLGVGQADAYAGYDAIFLESDSEIVEVACWAHARWKFFDARKNYPREAHQVLEWIGQLYDIEDRARDLSAEARCELRCAEANPVLDQLEAYLAALTSTLLPKSALSKAITYTRNQWDALRRYTADGRLTIDNNTSERTLRHQAIGRKNWLFLSSKNAGPRAAVLSTILAGAKRHRIEPWGYVQELLMRLHADDARLEEMLPDHWATAHPESILTHRLNESRAKAAAKSDRRQRRRTRTRHVR